MFVIEVPFFDLNEIYKSNQAIRWKKVNENKYIICHKDKIVLIQQFKDKKCLLCSEDEFYQTWFNYFDLKFDYYNSDYKLRIFSKKKLNPFFKLKLNQNKRILRQDIFETMVYYLLNKNNREEKFLKIISLGEKKKNTLQGMKVNWNKFPTTDEIIKSINNLKFYLDDIEIKRILQLCNRLNLEQYDLENLRYFNEEVVYILLHRLIGNEKWCKKVMFYSLGFKDCFVISEEEKRIFKKLNLTPNDFTSFPEIKGLILENLR